MEHHSGTNHLGYQVKIMIELISEFSLAQLLDNCPQPGLAIVDMLTYFFVWNSELRKEKGVFHSLC